MKKQVDSREQRIRALEKQVEDMKIQNKFKGARLEVQGPARDDPKKKGSAAPRQGTE